MQTLTLKQMLVSLFANCVAAALELQTWPAGRDLAGKCKALKNPYAAIRTAEVAGLEVQDTKTANSTHTHSH